MNAKKLGGLWCMMGLSVALRLAECGAHADNPCVANWTGWSIVQQPSLEAFHYSAATNARCLSVVTQGAYALVSASIVVIPHIGLKSRTDLNHCDTPDVDVDPVVLNEPTITWTASGCGATPTSGTGDLATFSVNSSGTCTVQFSVSATTPDSTMVYTTGDVITFNVFLNVTSPCTPPVPLGSGGVGLPSRYLTNAIAYDYPIFGCTREHHFNGLLYDVLANETFEADGQLVVSACGGSLIQSFTPGSWQWNGSVGIGPLEVSVGYNGNQVSSQIFGVSAVPYSRHYGQVWNHTISPTSGRFTGTDDWENHGVQCALTGTDHFNGTLVSLSGDEPIVNTKLGTFCDVPCCPSIP